MSDQRLQYTDFITGATHPTFTDNLNRIWLVEHINDGTHKMYSGAAGDIYYHNGTKLIRVPLAVNNFLIEDDGTTFLQVDDISGNFLLYI